MKQDYLTYEAEALAQEADFIQWVKSTDAAIAQQWEAWLRDHPEQADKVATAKALVLAVRWETPSLSAARKQEMWAAIDAATSDPRKMPVIGRRLWRIGSIAASIALLVALGWWWSSSQSAAQPLIVQTERAATKKEVLPDGSSVQLNAVSRIHYRPDDWQQARAIELEGEAFFEVEKGKPFVVNTSLGKVEVLGTSFNVEVREGIFRVNCYTGKVRVSTPQGETVVLLPQEGTYLQDGKLRARKLTNEDDIAWQTQTHYFTETSLAEVFTALERQYPITIRYPEDLAQNKYTGFFRNNDLEQALQAICWPLNLRYTIDQQRVTISADEQ